MKIATVADYTYKTEGDSKKKNQLTAAPSTTVETTNCTPRTITEMASNPESLMVGKRILEESRQRLEDKHELDKLMDHLANMEQEINKIKDMFKVKPNNSIYNAPAEIFTRLARTSTIPEVKTVISAAQHKIFILKSILRTCEKQQHNKIRAVLAQLEKSINRANGKINDLTREEHIQWQRKKAEKLAQYKRAEQIKMELDRQRTLRRSRERAQINEGKRWFYYPEDFLVGKNFAMPNDGEPQITTDTPAGADHATDIPQTIDVLL